MTEIERLASLMKSDWDRRVRHDYRFWMSDGYLDDRSMWEAGERDLEIVTAELNTTAEQTVLDIGCGVGRLLKPALRKFKRVIGVDISAQAIAKARELIGTSSQLELIAGDGLTLKPLPNRSVDVVISFAALACMPADILAQYLCEIHRVLTPNGVARLQLYVGRDQGVRKSDTLQLRCYERDNLNKALEAAGFSTEWIRELVLPFKVSFAELGIEAVIISLKKCSDQVSNAATISSLLLPGGEPEDTTELGSELEYWTALNYARELVERGDMERAEQSVEFAVQYCKTSSIDVRDLLDRIVKEVKLKNGKNIGNGASSTVAQGAPALRSRAEFSAELFEKNMRVLQERFPDVAAKLMHNVASPMSPVEAKETEEGTVLSVAGQCLDHPSKPRAAATSWALKLLQEKRIKDCEHIIVFGFGCGYHVKALLSETSKQISVVEPSPEVLRRAMGTVDLVDCLSRIRGCSVGSEVVPDLITENTELAVRPQTQALSVDYANQLRATVYSKRGFTSLHPKIGVLGPFQGGTLPISAYCARALGELKQRLREFDVSGFAPGYHLVESFLSGKEKQAAVQGTYVEMVSHILLEAITEKPIDILLCMALAPISGRVLTELRKRGIITVLWFVEDYHRFKHWKDIAQYYDFVFTIQRGECVEAVRKAGAGEAHYLPTGCDPFIHVPVNLSAEDRKRWGSPVSFVGAGYHNRQQVFASLAELPLKIWGTEWPTCKPFDRIVQEGGRRLTPAEYNNIFSATDVNINLHSSSERDGVDPFGDFLNPRTFELASAGAFQLVDHRSLLHEAFEEGKEVAVFRNTQELKEKIAYYMAHPEERRAMATRARTRAIAQHTYVHRLREMLTIIYNSKYEHLRRREEASPWHTMLKRSEPHPELAKRCKEAFTRGEEPNLDGLVSDIVNGKGKLTETEQKLLFLFHIRKQIIRMRTEEEGGDKRL